MGRSEDWLSKVERGDRQIRRVDVLAELAKALRVSLADVLGQPVLVEDGEADDGVPALRDALMAPRRLSRVLYADARTAPRPDRGAHDAEIRARIEAGWEHYQQGRLGRVIAVIPALIAAVTDCEDAADPGAAWASSARVHHLATSTLTKVGETELAWIAAEHAMAAADRAGDPLALASAARGATHALLAVGRYSDALGLGDTAAGWLRAQVRIEDAATLSLFGMLCLRTAIAAGRLADRSAADELLGRAEWAARRLGRDANYWQTGFGLTNVALHRIAVALDLGDVGYVTEVGPTLDLAGMPAERRVSHQIGLALALSLCARDEESLRYLLSAEAEAPSLVRHSQVVRGTVRALHRRSRPAGSARAGALLELAERCRAV